MSVEASPPPPPQLSPDGKYVWDGSQWQPIAGVAEPVHAAVFPAWNSIKVEPADPVAVAPQVAQVQYQPPMQVQEPAPDFDYSYTVNDPTITPLWRQQRSTGVGKYLYVGAGIVVLVIAVMLLNSLNLQLPWGASGSGSATPLPQAKATATPATAKVRSEYARADVFLNGVLAPTLDRFNQSLPAMQSCTVVMSNSCFNAMTDSEPLLKKVLNVIDQGLVPPCIAAAVANVRSVLATMDAGLLLGLKGYNDNQRSEVIDGLYRFSHYGQGLGLYGRAADQAQRAQCSTDLEGP